MEQFLASVVMLLPGFAATVVRDQLVPSAKKSDLERTLESLFWTFVIYFPFALWVQRPIPIITSEGALDTNKLVLVYLSSIVAGGLRALAVRQGWATNFARSLGLTERLPEPNIWLYAIRRNSPGWAIVHLKNGKKFYGDIAAYDDELDRSEFYMENVSELDEMFEEIRDLEGGGLLIAKDQAILVEFYREGVLEGHARSKELERGPS